MNCGTRSLIISLSPIVKLTLSHSVLYLSAYFMYFDNRDDLGGTIVSVPRYTGYQYISSFVMRLQNHW